MTNKEKFLALVTEKDTSFLEELNKRKENREMLRESQSIAFKILFRMDELGWSQKDLAYAMKVSPQQVNKIVKGQENLTLDTLTKIQNILNIPILASYIEKKLTESEFASYTDTCKVIPIKSAFSVHYVDLGINKKYVKRNFKEASSEYSSNMELVI
jgi:transcriptional regulator with XRE-family HTH domain